MYYIAPSFFLDARQARIVFKPGFSGSARQDYRDHPEDWTEVGLMDNLGQLRCLEAPQAIVQEFMDCQPLMAGIEIDELDVVCQHNIARPKP